MLTIAERVILLVRARSPLAEVPAAALARLVALGDEIVLGPGDRLYEPGAPADALHLVLEGFVEVSAPGASETLGAPENPGAPEALGADRHAPSRCGPGVLLDAAAVVATAPRAARATARARTLLLRIDRAELWALLGEEAVLCRAFLGITTTHPPAPA